VARYRKIFRSNNKGVEYFMKVWLVGSAGYDFSDIQYVCLSHESALKRWYEIRDNLIKQAEDMIIYEHDEGYTGNGGWEKDIALLQKLKPGETCQCDCPTIEEMEAEL